MANQLISSYLSDTSIPADTRRNIAKGLNNGDLSEDAAVHGITAKYGNKYGDSAMSNPSSPAQDSGADQGSALNKLGAGLGSAIGGAFRGAQNGGGLAGAVGGAAMAAPELAEGVSAVTKNAPSLSMQEQKDVSQNQPESVQNTQDWKKVEDQAKMRGMNVPSTLQNQDLSKNLLNSAQTSERVRKNFVEGETQAFNKIYNAGGTAGFGGAISGVGEHGEQLDAGERAIRAGKGIIDTVGGGLQGVFTPVTAVGNEVPVVKEAIQGLGSGINFVAEHGSKTFKNTLKSSGVELSPEQEALIDDGFSNLTNLLAMKVSHDTGKELSRQSGIDTATKAGDISKVEELTNQKPTITGNIGANIVKGTEAFTKPALEGAKQFAGTASQGVKTFTNPLIEHAQNLLSKHPDAAAPKVAEFAGSSTEPISDTGKAGAPVETDISKFKKTALRSGMKESQANLLANLPDNLKKNAIDYVKGGLDKLANPAKSGTLFDLPGKEIENFMSQAKQLKSQLGEKVSNAKEALVDKVISPVDVKNIKNVFETQLKKLNIKPDFDKMTGDKILNHADSDIGEAGGASALLDQIHKKLSKGQMSARDMEAITSKIDQATGLVKTSGYKGGTANTVLTNIKGALNDAINQAHPEFGEANAQYAKFIKDYQDAYNASKVPLNNGKFTIKGAQVLRRILGNADAKYTNALSAMENLAKNFGLNMPQDVLTKAHLADLAEKYTGATQPHSLAGGVEAGADAAIKRAPGRIGEMVEGAKAVKQYFNPKEITKENALRLVDMLQKSMKK